MEYQITVSMTGLVHIPGTALPTVDILNVSL